MNYDLHNLHFIQDFDFFYVVNSFIFLLKFILSSNFRNIWKVSLHGFLWQYELFWKKHEIGGGLW